LKLFKLQNNVKIDMKKDIFDAIEFAAVAHRGHFRKATQIPYISHLVNVMKVLLEHGYPEKVAMAGLLHDVVEDTSVNIEEIERVFGHEVAALVKGATEPQKLHLKVGEAKAPWTERKTHTINYLKNETSENILAVSCADKLDNIRSIKSDLEKTGAAVWDRFNAPYQSQKWYYSNLAQTLVERQKDFGHQFKSLTNDFLKTTAEVFQD
jgi:(p)ppGpp synthase/HD superfamily hydrolase